MKTLPSTIAFLIFLFCMNTFTHGQPLSVLPQQTSGRFIYPDGSVYTGDLVKGWPQGIGRVDYTTGSWYQGGWKDHAPEGEGVMCWQSQNKKIRGIWKKGQLVKTLPLESPSRRPVATLISHKPSVRVWAVVIGISQYQHMPSLRFADDDAYQVYSFLKSPAGGALSDAQVSLLIDEAATRENILRAMHSLKKRVAESDVVFFYFSGHGIEDAFVPSDYDGASQRVLHKEVVSILNDTPAKHKFIIADACHSGGIQSRKSVHQVMIEKFYAAFERTSEGTALLSSSKCEEYSFEDDGLRSGIFSYFLRKGIQGAADKNLDKIVSISELYAFVFNEVRRYTQNRQTPVLKGHFDVHTPVAVIQ